jgi:protein-disulfide isomerase
MTDLFRRRANQCRRLAAAARNANDREFWLVLAERWKAAGQRGLRQGNLDRRKQKHSPNRGG